MDFDTAVRLIEGYRTAFPQDAALVNELINLLAYYGTEFFNRTNKDGHVTCGAVLVDEQRRVLLIHHNALDKWLTPGGHVESTDNSLEFAARRELAEETGVKEGVDAVSDIPIHIDRHTIPANPKKWEGQHAHWDLRFLFTALNRDVSLQLEEVSGFEWREVALLPPTLAGRIVECIDVPMRQRR
jgi:8-oxo-dGTP pyrophosphatase MutT (NUDIX family)